MKCLVSPAISGIEKSLYAMTWVNFTQPPPPILLEDAKPLSTFLGTWASALESLMALAYTGTEKSQYVIIWVKSHLALPQPPDGRAKRLSTFLLT
jgi:hypothetical protein